MDQIQTKAFLNRDGHLMIAIKIGGGVYTTDEVGAIALTKAIASTVSHGRQIPDYKPNPQATAIAVNGRTGELISVNDQEF